MFRVYGWMILDWCFLENKSSSEGLLGSGYKTILQLKAHLQINCQPSLRIFALSFLPLPIAKRNVSLANCFPMDLNSSVKPLIETRKRSGTKIEDWGTPAKTSLRDDLCPFKTTLWSLLDRHFLRRF